MLECIENLLGEEDSEKNLECLCVLFNTIGREFDSGRQEEKMKIYFSRLNIIKEQKEGSRYVLSNRTRFMIQDLIDLRANNWVPRRHEVIPRPLDEIRREAKEEELKQQQEVARLDAAFAGLTTCLHQLNELKSPIASEQKI